MRPAVIVLVLAAASIALSAYPRVDIAASAMFHCRGEEPWCHRRAQPWDWLYRWGPLPGVACGVAGVGLAVGGTLRHRPRLRTAGLFLATTILIGPGLLGNSIKPFWGRPRPRQIVQFGGQREYTPVWRPDPSRRGTSFPSGHVATAFSVGSTALLVPHPAARTAIIMGSLAYGGLMGLARMAQGAHFASDVAWSATFAWVAILLSARLTLKRLPGGSGR